MTLPPPQRKKIFLKNHKRTLKRTNNSCKTTIYGKEVEITSTLWSLVRKSESGLNLNFAEKHAYRASAYSKPFFFLEKLLE